MEKHDFKDLNEFIKYMISKLGDDFESSGTKYILANGLTVEIVTKELDTEEDRLIELNKRLEEAVEKEEYEEAAILRDKIKEIENDTEGKN